MSDVFDSPWNEALEQYFAPFLELCFPEIRRALEWTREVVFLEQELREVIREGETGLPRVDHLARPRPNPSGVS